MQNLPSFIGPVFILTTFLTLYLFLEASKQNRWVLVICFTWMVLQAIIAFSGFYKFTFTLPPRIIAAVVPVLLFIIMLFISKKGKQFIDNLNVKFLVLLHVVRIPVEVVLFWLFCEGTIPQIMTFEGRNFDILSGISAPLIWYFGYIKNLIPKWILLFWNFLCLGLLFNIVIHAVLSVPTNFQVFGFEQPNIAILYFPFVWLPSFVVPMVLLSHLVLIRRLLINSESKVP